MYSLIFSKIRAQQKIKLFPIFPNFPANIKVLTGPKQINPTIVISRINKLLHELLI